MADLSFCLGPFIRSFYTLQYPTLDLLLSPLRKPNVLDNWYVSRVSRVGWSRFMASDLISTLFFLPLSPYFHLPFLVRCPREIALFEAGICAVGKDFHAIANLVSNMTSAAGGSLLDRGGMSS